MKKFEEDHALISGLWYYKELYVPSTIKEKKKSVSDLKEKRCTAISIHGKFDQIKDILLQGDLFLDAGNELSQEDLFTDAGKNKFSHFSKYMTKFGHIDSTH